MKSKPTPKQFEQSLSTLESIVAALEKGDLSLEESLQQFEQGIKLVQHCQTTLKQAEQKIEQLSTSSAMDATKDDLNHPDKL